MNIVKRLLLAIWEWFDLNGLWSFGTTMGMVRTYRVLWINGRYGGGKTALAFQIAAELLKSGHVRHCISNVRSPLRDIPEKIELRDGILADTVIVLDEAGIFLETGADVQEFLAYLRKMNIILIMPSVLPPPMKVRFLSIQRTMSLQSVGLPLWMYKTTLNYGNIKESINFGWWGFSSIFGLYDSAGFPADDGGIGEIIQKWKEQALAASGYKRKKAKSVPTNHAASKNAQDDRRTESDSGGQMGGELGAVDQQRRFIESLSEIEENISAAVSVFGSQSTRKRRG